jgi:hypothetical protein
LAVQYKLSCFDHPVLAVLSGQSCSVCPVLSVLFCLPCYGFLVLVILSWLFSGCRVLAVPFWLSSPFCLALAAGSTVLAALCWQSCAGSPVLAFHSWQSCPGVLFFLFACPVLYVLFLFPSEVFGTSVSDQLSQIKLA